MRQIIELVAILGAILASVLVLIGSGQSVAAPLDERQTLMLLGSAGGCAVLAFGLLYSTLMVLWVLITRGPKAIGWVDPWQCRSFTAWVNHEWSFFGVGGRQEGWRFCGLEVAYAGNL